MAAGPHSAIGQFDMLRILGLIVLLGNRWSSSHARGIYQSVPVVPPQLQDGAIIAPSPFAFQYSAEGPDGGSFRQESWDAAGNVQGGYSLRVADGRNRQVQYRADVSGFKAKIETNELGTKSENPADAIFRSSAASTISGPVSSGGGIQVSGPLGADGSGIPTPYAFDYKAEGIDGSSSHRESSDGAGNAQGTYSLNIKDGRRRKVDYTADAAGFRALVETNEQGTESVDPADVKFSSTASHPTSELVYGSGPPVSSPFGAAPGSPAVSFQLTPGGNGVQPYSFGYIAEGEKGSSSHHESSDGAGNVKGSYSLKIDDGRRRKVDYTADVSGFKATVDTNEPGTKSENPAQVSFLSSAPGVVPVGSAPGIQTPAILSPAGGVPGSSAVSFHLTPGGEGAPSPYSFSYLAESADGGSSHQESSDGAGNVRGSYSLKINDGRRRKVDYTADAGGFKANVDTNEPGTKSENPAQVSFNSAAAVVSPVDSTFIGKSPAILTPVHSGTSGTSSVSFGLTPGGEGAPSPYSFSYTAESAEGGSSHSESSDGAGNVKGSYSLKVKDGRRRKVDYTADAGGFKASVDTNEPGTKSDSPAQVSFLSSALPPTPAIGAPVIGAPAFGAVKSSSQDASVLSYSGTTSEAGAPKLYSFSYLAEGSDGGSSHQESSDGSGNVRGSYSLNVKDGRRRKVDYTADAAGFKATVDTNEPGTKSESPAQISFHSSAPQLADVGIPGGGAAPIVPIAVVAGLPSPGVGLSTYQVPSDIGPSGKPSPYSFSYTAEGADGGSSHHESSDGAGNVKGGYSLKIKDGRSRKVEYTADAAGFKANVNTNEPGTKSDDPAHVTFHSSAPLGAPALIPGIVPVGSAPLGAPFPVTYNGASGTSAVSFQLTPGDEKSPSPYSFGYTVEGKDGGNAHQESSDGAGNVKGSYSLKVKDGRSRRVDYTADAGGFQAKVDTNEPGTKSHSPAHASFYSSAPQAAFAGPVPAPHDATPLLSFSGGNGAPFYSFGYKAEGKEGESSHQESSDGAGNVKGSYSLNIKDGRSRKVDYTADAGGFKASVNTNEPGTKSSNPAEVSFHSTDLRLTPGDLHILKPVFLQATPPHLRRGVKSWV